jgi:hypothetical protein
MSRDMYGRRAGRQLLITVCNAGYLSKLTDGRRKEPTHPIIRKIALQNLNVLNNFHQIFGGNTVNCFCKGFANQTTCSLKGQELPSLIDVIWIFHEGI